MGNKWSVFSEIQLLEKGRSVTHSSHTAPAVHAMDVDVDDVDKD